MCTLNDTDCLVGNGLTLGVVTYDKLFLKILSSFNGAPDYKVKIILPEDAIVKL